MEVPLMLRSKLSEIDRCVGKLAAMFEAMMHEARIGQFVNALKLQKLFNEISERSAARARNRAKKP